MKNKKILLGMLILVFAFVLSSCKELDIFTVPDWAQGKWSINPGNNQTAQVEAATITDKEFIPTGELTTAIPLIKRTEVSYASDNKVLFDLIQVLPGDNAGEIKVGSGTVNITLYRMQ